MDHLPPYERWHGRIQPLFWPAEHGQDEDPGGHGPQGRHSRVRQQDAPGGIRGAGAGKEPEGAAEAAAQARKICLRYMEELKDAEMIDLAICRRVSRLNYSRRCAETSAVQAHMKQGIAVSPGMQIA